MQTTDSFVSKSDSNSRLEIFGVGIVLLIATGFFYPMLFDNKVLFDRDYNLITYPLRFFLSQTFSQGAIPYWIPYVNGGMPFMASFHPGVFYPPSLLFFLDDSTYALNLFYVLHFLIIGVFSFLLARSWNLSFVAALCSGITGMLSGFIVASTLLSNFFMAAVWLPMVFWMFHQFWTKQHIGYFIGLVLVIATQTLAACPEISILTMLLLYAHSIYFLPRMSGFSGIARMTAPMVLAVILALGLSSFQLIPTVKLIDHSVREGGLSYDQHTGWSMKPKKLSYFFSPPDYNKYLDSGLPAMQPQGEILKTEENLEDTSFFHTLYMGSLGLVFVFLGFFFRREKAVGFWLVVFLLGIFLALGRYNPLYQLVYHGVPFINLFRYPEKYLYISSFAVIFLTGYGLDLLIRHTRDRKIKIIWVSTIFIVLCGLFYLPILWRPSLNPEYSLGLLGVCGVAYILYYFGKIKEAWFAVLVSLTILVDLSAVDLQTLPLIDRKYYEEKPILIDVVGDSFGKHRIYSGKLKKKPEPLKYPNAPTRLAAVIASKELIFPYMGMNYNLEHVNGMPGLALELKKNMDWLRSFVHSPSDTRERILTRSNVKYWIDGDQLTAFQDNFPLILPDRVKILKDALPRAYLVPKMRLPEKGHNVLYTYYDKSFDPLEEVLLNQAVEFTESTHFKGNVESVVYRPNHVTVETSQEGNGFLVLMDSYFAGWTVKVDGEEKPILRANHFYRAVQLGPGKHILEFDFFPEGLKKGLVTSAMFLLILVALPLCKPIKRLLFESPSPSESTPDSPPEPSITS